jgi:hypothetical protein
LPSMPEFSPQVVLLLRNPLERSRSVYNFERSQVDTNTPGNQKARELPFDQYVKWRLEPGTGPVIRNFHTRYCSGDYFGKDIERQFEQAKKNLDSIPMVGFVHRYAESIVLFEEGLRDAFPDIDLSWRVQNSSQNEQLSQHDRLQIIEEELGNIFLELTDANKYDIMLLQYAEEKFERELSKILDIDARIAAILLRNELHK